MFRRNIFPALLFTIETFVKLDTIRILYSARCKRKIMLSLNWTSVSDDYRIFLCTILFLNVFSRFYTFFFFALKIYRSVRPCRIGSVRSSQATKFLTFDYDSVHLIDCGTAPSISHHYNIAIPLHTRVFTIKLLLPLIRLGDGNTSQTTNTFEFNRVETFFLYTLGEGQVTLFAQLSVLSLFVFIT